MKPVKIYGNLDVQWARHTPSKTDRIKICYLGGIAIDAVKSQPLTLSSIGVYLSIVLINDLAYFLPL